MSDAALSGLTRLIVECGNIYIYLHSLIARMRTPSGMAHFGKTRLEMRPATSDALVINEVWKRHMYGAPPRGTVLDIGANIGAYTLFAAQTANTVYAYEPEASNFAQLQKNIALNACTNIIAVNQAVGGQRKDVTLHVVSTNRGASSTTNAISGITQTVTMIRLDDIFKTHNLTCVDMLKVDIEGGEYELFATASLETLRKINRVVMETHLVPGRRVKDLKETLKAAGFSIRVRYGLFSLAGTTLLFASRPAKDNS